MNKNKLLVLSGIIIMVLSIFFLIDSLEEQIYCGKVVYKVNAFQYNKYNATPDPILIVDFYGYGKDEVHTSWTTFLESEVGDKVCFSKRIGDMEKSVLYDLMPIIVTIGFVGGFMMMLVGLKAFGGE